MTSASGSFGARLRGALAGVLALLQTRLQLLGVEMQEESRRLLRLLAYAAAAFFFLGFGVILLALLLTVYFWDSHRWLALGLFTAVFLGIGFISALMALRGACQRSGLFAASLAELARDQALIRPDDGGEGH